MKMANLHQSKIKLSFECYVEENDKIWFSAFDHNGLYCKDKKCDKINFIGLFPNEKKYAFRLYSSMTKRDNKLFFIPFLAEEIAIYDIKKDEFVKIPLKKVSDFGIRKNASRFSKFWCCQQYNDKLFLLPHNFPSMVVLDMDSLAVSYVDNFIDDLEKMSINGEAYITDSYVEKDIVYCSCGCTNAFAQISLETEEVFIHKIKYNGNGFNGITKSGTNIWMAPRISGSIICFDIEDESICEYSEYPDGFKAPTVPFHTIYKCDKGLLLVPSLGNQFIILDLKTGQMKNVKYLSDLINGKKEEDTYAIDNTMACSMEKDKLMFMNGANYVFYNIDMKREKFQTDEFYIESDYPQKEFVPLGVTAQTDDIVFLEREQFDLSKFIQLIQKYDLKNEVEQKVERKGAIIYEQVVKL